MYIGDVLDVLEKFIYGSADAVGWLFNTYDFGFVQLSPIMFMSFGGLLIYLGVAVVKWVVS